MRLGRWLASLAVIGGLAAGAGDCAANPADDVALRGRAFLEYIIAHGDEAPVTEWGALAHIDGHALAYLTLEQNGDRGAALLGGMLDMMERNLAEEAADPEKKWHVADFALMSAIRMWFLHRDTQLGQTAAYRSQWERLRRLAVGFRWHYGDLSENHNLLHMTGRYLVGQLWPDERPREGGSYARLRARAREDIRDWCRRWVRRGSEEWGSDLYYNVVLLALYNLHDFADEPEMRRLAKAMLDFLLLDEALDAFAGTSVGASRRTYASYRIDTRLSPARSLHHLYFGSGQPEPFNLSFVGGVLAAATSAYRPGPVITWIAANRRDTFSHDQTHAVGLFDRRAGHIGKHTWRSPGAVLSVLQSPGGGERSTEHVAQATLGERGIVFVNHPSLEGDIRSPEWPPDRILGFYRQDGKGDPRFHSLWVPGNVPPGSPGDTRPGYWQGNQFGPRSYGEGRLAFLVFRIGETRLPQAHIWLPRSEFDEVRGERHWIFARKGRAHVALWIPEGYDWTTSGTWAHREIMCRGQRSAVLMLVGDGGSPDAFRSEAYSLDPAWDPVALRLGANSPDDRARVEVEYERGPRRDGVAVSARGPRFATPWGTLPLGEERLSLRTPAGDLVIGLELPSRSWAATLRRAVERFLRDPVRTAEAVATRVMAILGLRDGR
jgi:hypothetical protein